MQENATIEIRKLELLNTNTKADEVKDGKGDDKDGKHFIRMKLLGLKGGSEPEEMDNLIDIFERQALEIGLEEKRWCHEFRKNLLDRGCGKYTTELGDKLYEVEKGNSETIWINLHWIQ